MTHEDPLPTFKGCVAYVCDREGGEINLDVAQVSECCRHTLDYLARMNYYYPKEVRELLENRYRDMNNEECD